MNTPFATTPTAAVFPFGDMRLEEMRLPIADLSLLPAPPAGTITYRSIVKGEPRNPTPPLPVFQSAEEFNTATALPAHLAERPVIRVTFERCNADGGSVLIRSSDSSRPAAAVRFRVLPPGTRNVAVL